MQFTIPLYDALLGANVSPEKAKAVVEALEKETETMIAKLATKDDLKAALDLLEVRMTVKLGAMLFAAVGITVTLMKVL
jgi:hypothetical protein